MPRSSPGRILVIQLRRFGDVVLSSALLDDLHRAFPGASIDMLVGADAAPLVVGHPALHERIVYDPDHVLRMWSEIRSRGYDWVVDLQGSLRTALLTRASRARVRLGWRIHAWRLFYTRTHPRGGGPEYVARERQRLLELEAVPVAPPHPRIFLSDDERTRGERDARSAGAVPDAPRVGLLLSTREPAKDWRIDAFGDLARSLLAQGVAVLVFQTPGDDARVARVRAMAPDVVVIPPLELRRFLGVLATCRVLVSGDTGPAHMADALDVARVTIFGPTSPVAWSPGRATTIALTGAGARVVPLRDRARRLAAGEDFTGGVTPQQVYAAVMGLLPRDREHAASG